jgi:predicted O-methyltransferase YrrM
MILAVQMPDGTTTQVEIDDRTFERARAAWEARGQTFEAAFTEYLQQVLEAQQHAQREDPRR